MQIQPWLQLVGSDQIGLTAYDDSNLYLLDGGNGEYALVDAGRLSSFEVMLENVRKAGASPEQIGTVLLTHGHTGHSEACALLRKRYGTKVVTHAHGVEFLRTGTSPARRFMEDYQKPGKPYVFPTFEPEFVIEDSWEIRIGRISIQALHITGHTEDSVCYLAHVDGATALFSGDTVFFNGMVGLLNLPGCNLDHYRQDILRLEDLGIDQLYPGHGIFVLRNGQLHVDMAIQQFRKPHVPVSYYEGLKLI